MTYGTVMHHIVDGKKIHIPREKWDVFYKPSPPNKETISGAPVGGDEPNFEEAKEIMRGAFVPDNVDDQGLDHGPLWIQVLDELGIYPASVNGIPRAERQTGWNEALMKASSRMCELISERHKSPRPAIPGLQEAIDVVAEYQQLRQRYGFTKKITQHISVVLEAARRYADEAARQSGVPEGYVCVPREPTEAMCDAGMNAKDVLGERTSRIKYRAMIAAARDGRD